MFFHLGLTLKTLASSPEDTQPQRERLERELDAARRISQALFQRLSIEDLVKQALTIALDVVGGEAGCVLLANSDSKQLVFYHAMGDKAPTPGMGFPWDKGIAGSVFQNGKPIVASDVQHDQRHSSVIDETTGYNTHDLIALPLKSWEGDPIGVMEILNKKDGVLNQDDVAILTIISAFTAISIEEARLFEEAKLAEVAHMLGDIGHDIKNMLMPVLNGAWLLQDELNELFSRLSTKTVGNHEASQKLTTEIIEMIGRNARRIQDRVREIADAVKGVTSPPNFASCEIAKIVEEVYETLRTYAGEKGISLNTSDVESLPIIEADERRLFNALYNLVNNAIPEVPSGGSVTIRGGGKTPQGMVKFVVEDTGRGMPSDIRDRLFTSRAVSTKSTGTGLGTKIVKDVIDLHQGHIRVESEQGKGTSFTIELPITQTKVTDTLS